MRLAAVNKVFAAYQKVMDTVLPVLSYKCSKKSSKLSKFGASSNCKQLKTSVFVSRLSGDRV